MIVCPRCGKLNQTNAPQCIGCGQALAGGVELSDDAIAQQQYPATNSPGIYNPAPPLAPPQIPVNPSNTQYSQQQTEQRPASPFGLTPPTGSVAAMPWAPAPFVPKPIPCLVCGYQIPFTSKQQSCPRCLVPIGYIVDPNDITCSRIVKFAGSAIPIAAAPVFGVQDYQQAELQRVPGWNWGAAIFSMPWAFRHKRWGWAVMCLLNCLFWALIAIAIAAFAATSESEPTGPTDYDGLINLVAGVLFTSSAIFWIVKTVRLGNMGNTFASNSGLYQSDEEMTKAQRRWTLWGAWLGAPLLVLVIAEFIWGSFH